MSPFLFCAVIHEVIDQMDLGFGAKIRDVPIAGGQYADDMFFVAQTTDA